jgi:hypothetical protein
MLPKPLHEAAAQALSQGQAWLLAQQSPDGGWHSKTYGGLQGGAGLTALMLYTFRNFKPTAALAASVAKAAKFLAHGFDQRKTIAAPDGSLDYPTYASALILTAARQFPALAEALPPTPLIHYLLAAQVSEKRGFAADDAECGGWDLLGGDDAQGITTGTNVSVTCFVLEALSTVKANAQAEAINTAKAAALAWLKRAQAASGDGGFPFTAKANSLNNKAEWKDADRSQPRSYGSATCDGLRGLLACGLGADDAAPRAALQWLSQQTSVDRVPGFETAPPELGWQEGLRFYYAQSLAIVLPLLPREIASVRAEALAKHLIASQKPPGIWKNGSARMREDDPLIATCFGVQAISSLLRAFE